MKPATPTHAEAAAQFGRAALDPIRIAAAGVRAADPRAAVRAHLPAPPRSGRVAVFAFGKAALPMAEAVSAAWADALGARLEGLAVSAEPPRAIPGFEVRQAGHPVPDARSVEAARAALARAETLDAGDVALALVSGGGSALLAAPAAGVTLEEKQALTDALLASGATINEINVVRKRFSAIKGGRLAAAVHPARLLTLAVSDVPGDDPAAIASGPTAPAPSTMTAARAIAQRHGLGGPDGPRLALPNDPAAADAPPVRSPGRGLRGQESFRVLPADRLWRDGQEETPKPGDPCFARAAYRIVVSPAVSLAAAQAEAERLGWPVEILGAELEGEAADIGRAHGEIARARAAAGARVALLSGGELTVTLGAARGRGGPNREYLLALTIALDGAPGVRALALDTDGADGAPTADGAPVAGALALPDTLVRAAARGLSAETARARHESGAFFEALGDDLRTGWTGTNVNDLRLILVEPA